MAKQQIAGMESFPLKLRTVAGDEKPMVNLAAQHIDSTDGRKLPPEFRISRIGRLR